MPLRGGQDEGNTPAASGGELSGGVSEVKSRQRPAVTAASPASRTFPAGKPSANRWASSTSATGRTATQPSRECVDNGCRRPEHVDDNGDATRQPWRRSTSCGVEVDVYFPLLGHAARILRVSRRVGPGAPLIEGIGTAWGRTQALSELVAMTFRGGYSVIDSTRPLCDYERDAECSRSARASP